MAVEVSQEFDAMKKLSDEISSDIEKNVFNKDKLLGIIGDNIAKLENLNKTIDFQLPVAEEKEKEKSKEIKDKIQAIYSQAKEKIESVKDNKDEMFKIFVDNLVEVKFFKKEVELYQKSNSIAITLNSYYIYCYSIFDSFINELLRYIFIENNDYLKSDEKSISHSKILSIGNHDKIITYIINKDIEDIQRKSYIKQFLLFEKMFELPLRKFENWSKFVENSQRRNIIVHCNGIVSEQYISVCKENNVDVEDNILGQQLKVDKNYLMETIELLTEIIFKLGQTLWRKIFPEQMKEADIYLANYIYNLLQNKNYKLSLTIGDFGVKLPKYFNDLTKRPILVNYAIALRETNEVKELNSLLDRFDWSSTIDDFKVAYSVLKEDYNSAYRLLRKIGKVGEFISESAYLAWPLFIPLREKPEFQTLFEEVYGKSIEAALKDGFEKSIDENIDITA